VFETKLVSFILVFTYPVDTGPNAYLEAELPSMTVGEGEPLKVNVAAFCKAEWAEKVGRRQLSKAMPLSDYIKYVCEALLTRDLKCGYGDLKDMCERDEVGYMANLVEAVDHAFPNIEV